MLRDNDIHAEALTKLGLEARLIKLREEAAELVEALDDLFRDGMTDDTLRHVAEELADVVTVGKSVTRHPDTVRTFLFKCQSGEAKLATIIMQAAK